MTAFNTAFMLAQPRAAVLIIACDLRRPRLHTQFEVPNSKGLTTWLSGERDLDGLLQVFPKTPNLKILTSGPVPPNPDRKSTRLNSSHLVISYAVFCLKTKTEYS